MTRRRSRPSALAWAIIFSLLVWAGLAAAVAVLLTR